MNFNPRSPNFFYLDGDVVKIPGDFRLLPFQMCWNSWNSFSGDDLIRIRSTLLNIETFDSKLANLDHLSWVMICYDSLVMSHDHDEENAANHLHWYWLQLRMHFNHLSSSTTMMRLYDNGEAVVLMSEVLPPIECFETRFGHQIPVAATPCSFLSPLLGFQSLRNSPSNSEWLIKGQFLGKFVAFVLLWRIQFQYLCFWSQQMFFRGNTDVVSPFLQSHCATVPGKSRLPSREKRLPALCQA